VGPTSVWRIENWEEIFNNLTNAVRKNIVKVLHRRRLPRLVSTVENHPIEVFGLDKADIVVLVVEGYEDCGKPQALLKRFFDAKVVIALNKHEKASNTQAPR
jgi:chromosome partitioning protein